MGTLADAIRDMKRSDAPVLRAPRLTPEQIEAEQEARRIVTRRIIKWLSAHWDCLNDEYTLAVYDVLEGDWRTWEAWLDLAPYPQLERAADLMELSGE